ncbi:MAG: class I SAM-dependent methyltransferase [Actinomycetes bacterium]
MTEILSSQEAISYWDQRHRSAGELQSGGHISYDDATNEILYQVRLGRLLELLGCASAPTYPVDVLDAGCGKGWFARALVRCGYRVEGFDASPAAIEHCIELGGGARYAVSTLSAWTSVHGYDAVYALDVLFHVTEDDEWARSVRNLASCVRLGGRLLLSDWNLPERRVLAGHQVARPASAYRSLLAPMGVRYDRFVPDGFRDNGVGFHVLARVG